VFCDRSRFLSGQTKAFAFNGEGVDIGGSLSLRSVESEGSVWLLGAKLGRDLGCDAGQFLATNGPSLSAAGARIGGSAFLRGAVQFDGKVNFRTTTVTGSFEWHGVKTSGNTKLDLGLAKVRTLVDDPASWPGRGNLALDGFVFDQIQADSPTDAETRIEWLKLQPAHIPQSYEQLAGVLRMMGYEEQAKRVMIAKNEEVTGLFWLIRPFWWLFGRLAGYGYRPWWAVGYSAIVVAIGTGLFAFAKSRDIITPTDPSALEKHPEAYPRFNPFAYSLQKFMPLLELEVAKHWRPNPARRTHISLLGLPKMHWPIPGVIPIPGVVFLWYLWFHVFLGLVLTGLWLHSFTKLVKI